MSHNKSLLGKAIPSQNKGTSSLTAVDTSVWLTDFLQAQHSRPVLGHHPVLAQPINLSCQWFLSNISSQQPSLIQSLISPACIHHA